MSNLKEILHQLSYILYPKRCFFCNEIINVEDELCAACTAVPEEEYRISGPRCKSCGVNKNLCKCKSKSMFYSDIIAPYYYINPVNGAVKQYKFNGKKEKAARFAAEIHCKLRESYPDMPFDGVCYVPQTGAEMRERGYNQAERLAQEFCTQTGLIKLNALVKLYDTHRQRDLPAAARSGNVMGVFDVAGTKNVHEMNILLVDDIKTTGSTLNECAKMLMIHGANTVTAAVYAIAKAGNK